MIVYRELSSLENDLGCSAKMLYTLSNSVASHYHTVKIPKGNGEFRTLCVPDDELKTVQRRIAERILCYAEISSYATAYRPCGSALNNARPHVGHKIILKLDIRHFFDKITYYLVKEKAFPDDVFSEPNRILLAMLCCHRDCLPQGAPSSPVISNIILRDFDNTVGVWCGKRSITYTRYCDDLTFSGDFDPASVKSFVSDELYKLGFYLNEKKTVAVKDGQKKLVTGIVVNERAAISAAYKRKIRQEMYYCMKYGIPEHLKKADIKLSPDKYHQKLLGKVNYVLSVEKQNGAFKEYRAWLMKNKERKEPKELYMDAKETVAGFLKGEISIIEFKRLYDTVPEIDGFLQSIVDNIKMHGGEMRPHPARHPATGEIAYSVGPVKYLLAPETCPSLQYGCPAQYESVRQMLNYEFRMTTHNVHTAAGALRFYDEVFELYYQIDDSIPYDEKYSEEYGFALDVIPEYLAGGKAEQYIQEKIIPSFPETMKKGERKKAIKARIKETFKSEKGYPCWAQSSEWPFGADGKPAVYIGKGKSDGDLRRWLFRDEITGDIIIVEQYL